ncbi:MAG: 50S ribosomal protein L17 [Planctomycetota bacterium]
MRHRKIRGILGRKSSHRKALRRNLALALFESGRVVTTPEKAKAVRPFAEKLITLAREKSLANYRRALSILPHEAMVRKLFNEIAPRYSSRPGGYTRIIRHFKHRIGDSADLVIWELVTKEGSQDKPEEPGKGKGK